MKKLSPHAISGAPPSRDATTTSTPGNTVDMQRVISASSNGILLKSLSKLDQCLDPVGDVGPQIRGPDHRPRANPKVVQTRRDKRRDASLGLLAVLHLVADRVPEERRHVVFAIGEIRLWIYRDEPIALAEDVVMVEVAVHYPIRARVELGEQLARERNQLAAGVLRAVEPAPNLGHNRPERRSRRAPQL